MAKVRRTATEPELLVRKTLSSFGVRYRTANHDLPGSPDLANRRRRWTIFVHGCFWHRHAGCSRSTTPKRNIGYWEQKFRRNVQRDAEAARRLRESGWHVYTIWECCAEESARTVGLIISDVPQRKHLRR